MDMIDTNPPLVMYINVVPVVLARLLDLDVILIFTLVVHLIVLFSMWQLAYLLARCEIGCRRPELALILIGWSAGNLVVYTFAFGQREHLFVVYYLPFLVSRLLRYNGETIPLWFASVLGLQAAIGLCLKPHFCLVAMFIEFGLMIRMRHMRALVVPEIIICASAGALYAAHWLFVPQDMREQFFGRWLPLVRDYYDAYSVSYGTLMRQLAVKHDFVARLLTSIGVAAVAASLVVWFRCRRPQSEIRLLVLMAFFLGMSLTVFFWQRKGWVYHLIPFHMVGLLTSTMLIVVIARGSKCGRLLVRIRFPLGVAPLLAGATLLAVFCAAIVIRDPLERHHDMRVFSLIKEHSRMNDPIVVVSTSVSPAYPAVAQLARRPGSRYLTTFPIAFFSREAFHPTQDPRYAGLRHASEAQKRFIMELRCDIGLRKPKLILVRNSDNNQGCPKGFNICAYIRSVGILEEIYGAYSEVPGSARWRAFVRVLH